jgi:hypothetical protein
MHESVCFGDWMKSTGKGMVERRYRIYEIWLRMEIARDVFGMEMGMEMEDTHRLSRRHRFRAPSRGQHHCLHGMARRERVDR